MLNQALEVFKKEYEEKGDSFILDTYIPADGTYIVVKPTEDNFVVDEIVDIKVDKKTRSIDRTISQHMDFICFADYYSKVTDMNKAILSGSGKVIQGNNYLSFIIKKESLTNGKLTNEIIDKYYSYLEDPRLKYTKIKALNLYNTAEQKLGQVDEQKIHRIKTWVKQNLFEQFTKFNGKDYMKIFFYYSKELYKKESERYYIPNIYNNNDYNKLINDTTYGLPNDNMGLNSKKPYLEHKTRKVTVPFLVNQEQVILQKKFFDYLMNQACAKKVNIYIGDRINSLENNFSMDDNFKGIFLRIKKGKEVEILDYDVIYNFNNKLNKPFEYINILDVDDEVLNAEYGRIHTLSKMQEGINEIMFSKCLTTNYFTEPKDIKIHDNILKYNILTCRNALFNWFYKGKYNNIWILLNKASLSLIKGSICNENIRRARDQFNLWFSMKEYFEGEEDMADIIFSLKENLRSKVSKKSTSYIESDEKYLFAVGQLVNFFISKSKGKKKPLSLANPFVNAKNDKVIKNKLKALYKKYNYDIDNYEIRFKTLYAMVMSYELESKVNDDMIIAGFLHSNLLYEKENKGEVSNE